MPGFFKRLLLGPPGVPRVKAPILGILDLSDGEGAEIAAADRGTLGPLFANVITSTDRVPICNVLLLYCKIASDGRISGCPLGLREIIRDSTAQVVVLAMPNNNNAYVAAAKRKRYGRANLVFILDREGNAFGVFFHRLFTKMKEGISMPLAWNLLAPQIPGTEHSDAPSSYCILEVGHLAFD